MTAVGSARTADSVRAELRAVRSAPYRAAGLVVAAVAADQAFDPTSTHVPLCPLHALTGLWCPFCGGLRSAFELTRLHLRAALHDNLVVVAAAPIVLVLWLDAVGRARSGRPARRLPRGVI